MSGESSKKQAVDAPSLPDTAKDIYGEAEDVPDEKEKKLEPKERKSSAPEELPELEFPEEEKKKSPEREKPSQEHTIVEHSSESVPSMEDEIRKFEDSIQEVYSGGHLESHEPQEFSEPAKSDHGFFSEFHRFLEGNDIPHIAEGLEETNLLDKMKEYHSHKEEGKPYYFHEAEIRKALRDNMNKLRNLEGDWFVHKQKMQKEEERMLEKEEQIAELTDEVKFLLQKLKSKSDFMKEIPEKDWFYLSNGHKLKSLSDLRSCLRVIDDEVFSHHVNESRNDFANWVAGAFDKKDLARELKGCDSRQQMLRVLANAEKN